jgi:hypothetical protein
MLKYGEKKSSKDLKIILVRILVCWSICFDFWIIVDEKAFGQDGYGAKASNVLMQVE